MRDNEANSFHTTLRTVHLQRFHACGTCCKVTVFLVIKVPTHGNGMKELQLARTCICVGGMY